MEFMLPIPSCKLPFPIRYTDRIMLTGSCFTEHIGNALKRMKFHILQNPNGILFDPISVASSLSSYIEPRLFQESELHYVNELWHSWDHHSRFSSIDAATTVKGINQSQHEAHNFLKTADWLIITLGSSFSYHLNQNSEGKLKRPVANCHRAPGQWFDKEMSSIETIVQALSACVQTLLEFNPKLKFIVTVSPVRHIRDGVVQNNRSKARLIEAVHQMVNNQTVFYFPAYELVIDVLRDYRFYDIDLVHPNYSATEFVLEQFMDNCFDPAERPLLEELKRLVIAGNHKPFNPDTEAHRKFLDEQFAKATALQKKYPFLDLSVEIAKFSRT